MPDTQQPTQTPDPAILAKAEDQLIAKVGNDDPEPATATEAPAPSQNVDDVEYAEAQAALKAEQDALASKDNPPPAPAQPEPAQPEAAPAATAEPATAVKPESKDTIMIPKPRLDEALRKADEANSAANYWKGIADARADMAKPGAQGQPAPAGTTQPAEPVKTPQHFLDEIDIQRVALAEKYDSGEMTMTEFRKADIQLERQATTIRDELIKIDGERLRNEAVTTAKTEAMGSRLDEVTASLETQHPGVFLVDSEEHWAFLREEAVRQMNKEGIKADPTSIHSMAAFRSKVAELADQYVPIWTGKPLPQKAGASAPQPAAQPQQATTARQVKPIAEQRQAKIDLANQQPANTSAIGSQGGQPQLTDAQIQNMSDDEVAALPDAVRARIKAA